MTELVHEAGARATAAALDAAKSTMAAGGCAEFGGALIDAGWVRELVIGGADGCAVWIRGASVAGLLNLRDARRRSGGPANALTLERCALLGAARASAGAPAVDASHAHLERLSLRECEVSGVELSGAVIVGQLDLDGIHGRDDGPCWVKARGVRVGRSLSARRARLELPWAPEAVWRPVEPNWDNVAPYALDLAGAEIGGSLTMWPAFEARGGVSLSGAAVGESLRASGALLTTAGIETSRDALFAQYARIGGPVFLSADADGTRCRSVGPLNFYGAEIAGAVDATGVTVAWSGDVSDGSSALYMPAASISGDVLLYPDMLNAMNLVNATFGAKVDIFGPQMRPIESIAATTSRIRGDLILGGRISNADFSGATVDGRVALGEPGFELELFGVNDVARISLADAHVGRDLAVAPITTHASPIINIDVGRPPLRIRTRALACYPDSGWQVAIALFPDTVGKGLVLLNFLHRAASGGELELVVLDGSSNRIHELTELERLEIVREDRAEEYLSFFCANVWGDEGPFLIEPGKLKLTSRPEPGHWLAEATVEYSTARFRAKFEVTPDGAVAMADDEPLELLEPALLERRLYARPFRWFKPNAATPTSEVEWPADAIVQPEDGWQELGQESELFRTLSAALGRAPIPVQPLAELPAGWPRPTIDLGGLTVAALADDDGRNWFGNDGVISQQPKLRLQLVGFEYERIQQDPERDSARKTAFDFNRKADDAEREGAAASKVGRRIASLSASVLGLVRRRRTSVRTTSDDPSEPHAVSRMHARMTWLKSQYATYPPLRDYYQPEPYVQLARTMRKEGNIRNANEVMYEKNLLRARLRPKHYADWPASVQLLYRAIRFPQVLLIATVGSAVVKPIRMLGLFVAVWLSGILVLIAFPSALKVETGAVSSVLTTRGGVVVQKNNVPTKQQAKEIVCGDRISKVVYPVDVMIPFVDLRQESRCDFAASEQGWAVAKGVYALVGWILTAGVILSASNLVRRQFDF